MCLFVLPVWQAKYIATFTSFKKKLVINNLYTDTYNQGAYKRRCKLAWKHTKCVTVSICRLHCFIDWLVYLGSINPFASSQVIVECITKCSLLLLSNVYEYKSSFFFNLSSLVLGCVGLLFANKEQKSLDHGIFNKEQKSLDHGIFNIFVAYASHVHDISDGDTHSHNCWS